MVLGRALSWTAERYPERTAVAGERPLTYADWDRRTNRLARALGGLGVQKGGRVAIVAGNGEPLASAHLAAQKLGAASVPLEHPLHAGGGGVLPRGRRAGSGGQR